MQKFKEYINEYTKYKLSELIGLRAIPLSAPMLDRLGYAYETDAYHLTNIRHLKDLVKIQGTKKQISVFTQGGDKLARLPSQPDILVKLTGTSVIDGHSDIWTLVDNQGRRWIDQSNRVQGNKLTFRINGILQKLIQTDEDIGRMSSDKLTKLINNLDSKQRSELYKNYINEIERYLDSGGYKDLSDYLKKISPDLDYNELILTNFKIDYVKTVDVDSPHTLAEIERLGLKYDGHIQSRDFKKLRI